MPRPLDEVGNAGFIIVSLRRGFYLGGGGHHWLTQVCGRDGLVSTHVVVGLVNTAMKPIER